MISGIHGSLKRASARCAAWQGLSGSHISRAHCCSSAASLPAAPWLTSSKQHLRTVAGHLSAVQDPDAVPGACKLAVRTGISGKVGSSTVPHTEATKRYFALDTALPTEAQPRQ